MTTDITELAQSLKVAAEKAGIEQWVNNRGEVNTADYEVDGGVYIDHICDCEIVGTESPRAEFIALANPANILALVEALEKAQQHIARQEQILLNQDESLSIRRGELEAAHQRIAELESRTVTVKLPEPPGPMSVSARTVYFGIVADVVSAFQYGLTAAGIKVEAE